MIRVHALLQPTRPHREIATQTDHALPSIARHAPLGQKANRLAHSHAESPLAGKGSPKGSNKQRWLCAEQGRLSSIAGVGKPSDHAKYPRGSKENANLSASSSKLEAKAFKFLRFEEDLLRNAILKHLDGRELSRQERCKIKQKAHFSFLSTDPNLSRSRFDDDFAVIEIPEEERITVSVGELVDEVRETYAKLGVSGKGRDVMLSALHRRIAQVVESLLAQADRPILQPALSSCDKLHLLADYLQRYVGETERTSHCFSASDSKLKLLGFYQEVYNRYESVPFSEDNEEPVIVATDEPIAFLLKSPTSTGSRGKSSVNSEESFIKLRFYNNLRKEVQTLSEDTEKIMQEESSKMTHP